MSKLTDKIAEASRPIVESLGLNLWEVEYLREGGQRYLRIYIDSSEGVSLEDCEAVSRKLDPLFDELDPIEESYIFEVSSAGAERQLKSDSDFELCIGRDVLIKTYKTVDGKKEFRGSLIAYNRENGEVTVNVKGADMKFTKNEIAKAQLTIKL